MEKKVRADPALPGRDVMRQIKKRPNRKKQKSNMHGQIITISIVTVLTSCHSTNKLLWT